MDRISLPRPVTRGQISVEEAIFNRISRREFQPRRLTLSQAGQLLWSAGGTGAAGNAGPSRAAPSAGATYPLELYLMAGEVEGIEAGLYHYLFQEHALELLREGDLRVGLSRAALGQKMIARAPLSLIVAAFFERTTGRYGDRGHRYIHMEVGHVAQNIYLQAEALHLATVSVGAFNDAVVKQILATGGTPLKIMPVGHRP